MAKTPETDWHQTSKTRWVQRRLGDRCGDGFGERLCGEVDSEGACVGAGWAWRWVGRKLGLWRVARLGGKRGGVRVGKEIGTGALERGWRVSTWLGR